MLAAWQGAQVNGFSDLLVPMSNVNCLHRTSCTEQHCHCHSINAELRLMLIAPRQKGHCHNLTENIERTADLWFVVHSVWCVVHSVHSTCLQILLDGLPLQRTWTLLTQDVNKGADKICVSDSVDDWCVRLTLPGHACLHLVLCILVAISCAWLHVTCKGRMTCK